MLPITFTDALGQVPRQSFYVAPVAIGTRVTVPEVGFDTVVTAVCLGGPSIKGFISKTQSEIPIVKHSLRDQIPTGQRISSVKRDDDSPNGYETALWWHIQRYLFEVVARTRNTARNTTLAVHLPWIDYGVVHSLELWADGKIQPPAMIEYLRIALQTKRDYEGKLQRLAAAHQRIVVHTSSPFDDLVGESGASSIPLMPLSR